MAKIREKIKKFFDGRRGTTLIELLIALAVFAIFVTIAIGGFLQSLSNQRLVIRLSEATDTMSLTLEQIMREVRVGSNFSLGAGNSIQFTKYDEEGGVGVVRAIKYELEEGAIRRTVMEPDTLVVLASDSMTAENITIEYFKAEVTILSPARVTLVVGVSAQDKKTKITNYIQTTVSTRTF